MKIKIYIFAYDTANDGTGCQVFARKDQLNAHLLSHMREALEKRPGLVEESLVLRVVADRSIALPDAEIEEAWNFWEDRHLLGSLDTYNIDEAEVDLEGTPAGELLDKFYRMSGSVYETLSQMAARENNLPENMDTMVKSAQHELATVLGGYEKLQTVGG